MLAVSLWMVLSNWHDVKGSLFIDLASLRSSDEITFNDNYSLEQEFAQKYISKYSVGKKVVVYYDPHDPSFSVLEPEEKGDAVVKLFFVAFFVSSVCVLYGGYLLMRRL